MTTKNQASRVPRILHIAKILFGFLLCCVLLSATATGSQNLKNQSSIKVFFKVNKGYPIVDRAKSRGMFIPSALFCETLGISADQCKSGSLFIDVENDIFDDLDNIFKHLPDPYQGKGRLKIYQLALDDAEKKQDANNELKDALTIDVSTFSGSWDEFFNLYEKWRKDKPSRRSGLAEIFTNLEGNIENNPSAFTLINTALVFSDMDEEGASTFDSKSGVVKYNVTDPIKDWLSKTDYKVCFPPSSDQPCEGEESGSDTQVIRKLLSSLKTRLWRPGVIRSRISEYYAQQGLLPVITFNTDPFDSKFINIQKSSRLGRILFPANCIDDANQQNCDDIATIEKLLYLLLPDKDFHYFVDHNPTEHIIEQKQITVPQKDGAESIKFRMIDYLRLAKDRKRGNEPLLNQFQLQDAQLQLQQAGFAITLSPNGESERRGQSYVDLNIIKMTDSKDASTKLPDNAPKPSAIVPNQHGVLSPQEGKHNDFIPKSPEVSSGKEQQLTQNNNSTQGNQPSLASTVNDQSAAPKERKNYLGGGFEYKPGQGIRFFGLGQRSQLGPGNLSAQVGGNGGALYSVNYSADFAFFGSLHRRLSLQFTGSSDFEASRVFGGVKTDEQRKVGLARAELELFRDLGGQLLRFSVEGRRSTVELKQEDQTIAKQNLSVLEIGSYYLLQKTLSVSGRRLSLEPRLRLGLGLAKSESNFTAFTLKSNYHQRLPQLFEFDLSGRVETASEDTPIFEQPSFGGADGVRGFRRDDAIGRKLWALQPELWTPVPGTRNILGGPENFLHSKLRLAGFFDVGGVYRTTGSTSGLRSGPGLGIRVIYNPVVLKVDWAYGIGEGITGGGHGRFYFSVTFNRPF